MSGPCGREPGESPALADAARLLRHRLRSVAELRLRLRGKGYAESAIDDCVARLTRAGFLDDRKFALAFVRDGVQLQQRGAARLRRELRAKGVADELIDEALELALPAGRADEVAAAVAAKYAPRLAGLPPLKAKQRLAAYLQRRGFGMDQIAPLLEQYLGDEPEAES